MSWLARQWWASSAAVPGTLGQPVARRTAARRAARAAGSARRAAGRRRWPRAAARAGTRSPASPSGTSSWWANGLADRLLVLRLRPARQARRDQLVLDPPAGHRGGLQHLLAAPGQPLDPAEQQVGQPGGQHAPAGAARRGGQQLLGVVGVAFGPADDDRPGPRASSGPGQGGSDAPPSPHRAAARARSRSRWAAGAVRRPPPAADGGGAGRRSGRWRPPPPAPGAAPGSGTSAGHAWTGRPSAGPPARAAPGPPRRARRAGRAPRRTAAAGPSRAGRPGGWAGPAVGQQPVEHRPGGDRVGRAGRAGAGGGIVQRVGQRQVRDAVAELGAPAGQYRETAVSGPDGQFGDQPGLAHCPHRR